MGQRKIARVSAYDPDDPETIAVEFDTGHIVMLSLECKFHDPLFKQIKELNLPRTDGQRVFWANGASLTVDDIMVMLNDSGANKTEKQKEGLPHETQTNS